jgi:hypothetical protein
MVCYAILLDFNGNPGERSLVSREPVRAPFKAAHAGYSGSAIGKIVDTIDILLTGL